MSNIDVETMHNIVFEWDDPNPENELIDSFIDAVGRVETNGYNSYICVSKRTVTLADLVSIFTGIQVIAAGSWSYPAKLVGGILLVAAGVSLKVLSDPEGGLLEIIDYKNGTPKFNTQIVTKLAQQNPEFERALANLTQHGLIYENKEGHMFISESSLILVKI